MKSATEKTLIALISSAMLLTGCRAPVPLERAARELEQGGSLYFTMETTPGNEFISEFYSALEVAMAESEIPNRNIWQSCMAVSGLWNKLAGFDEIKAIGASSSPDGSGKFSNRLVFAAQKNPSGWMWRSCTETTNHLREIGNYPGDTALALDFNINFAQVVKDIEASDAREVLKRKSPFLLGITPKELLNTISGNWKSAFAISPGGSVSAAAKYNFFVSFPDKDKLIFNRISAIIPIASPGTKKDNNNIYLPANKGLAPVVNHNAGRISIFSTPAFMKRFLSAEKRLKDNPDFIAAVKKLPADSCGAFYSSDHGAVDSPILIGGEKGLLFSTGGKKSSSIGVWQNQNDLIKISSISTEPIQVQALQLFVTTPALIILDRILTPEPQPEVKKDNPATQKKTLADKEQIDACRKQLAEIWKSLDLYRKKHGSFPPGYGKGVLKKYFPKMPDCQKNAYIYFGTIKGAENVKTPLVADSPGSHPGTINILFSDGSVETVVQNNPNMKKLCSFLHTRYKFEEKLFIRLIERASQLDNEEK